MSGTGDPFDLPSEYFAAAKKIIKAMSTGLDTGERHLPEGPYSGVGLEAVAREYCKIHPQSDLGVMYGLLAVGTMVAAQGAYVLRVPIGGGGWLEIPAIQHFMAEAPSGWRKSTALNVMKKPLERAMDIGVVARLGAAAGWKAAAIEAYKAGLPDPGFIKDGELVKDAQFDEVYDNAVCARVMAKDLTVEALRDMAVDNGGSAAVLAGEADLFRNVSGYGGDAGSLTFFLDLWDQDSVETVRVKAGFKFMRCVALNFAVLFQTDVFAEVTSGDRGRKGGSADGGDSFVKRGMFGRSWVVEALVTGGHAEIAAGYGDGVDVQNYGADGTADVLGQLSPYGAAMANFEGALSALSLETSDYRAKKAVRRNWLDALAKYGLTLQVPEPDEPDRLEILLTDASARLAYQRVQRMQLAVQAALEGADEDMQVMWNPLAARLTQHVLRDALATAFAMGLRTISGELIMDMATRVLPWRWGMQVSALTRRAHEIVEDSLGAMVTENRNMTSLAGVDVVRSVMIMMAKADEGKRAAGYTKDEIFQRVKTTLPRSQRGAGLSQLVGRYLDELIADDHSGVLRKKIQPGVDGNKKTVARFVITKAAVEASFFTS